MEKRSNRGSGGCRQQWSNCNSAAKLPGSARRARAQETASGGRRPSISRFFTGTLTLSDPMGNGFDYAKAFESLDLDAVIRTCMS